MSYCVEFRERVLSIREKEGLSFSQASKRFGVSMASLQRWAKRIEPIKVSRRMRKIDLEKLKEHIRKHPDAYQRERATRFGVTQKAIWSALRKIGVTYKKNSTPSQSGRRSQAILPEDNQRT